MKVIILAAGKGSRLKLGKKPKFAFSIPFLLLGRLSSSISEDEFLIENLFKNLNKKFEALFVLGFKFMSVTPILSYLSQKYGVKIDYVVNPIFNETNTAYSLWLALKSLVNEDNNYLDHVLIFNGDNYLSKEAWEKVKEGIENNKSFIVIDVYKKLDEESFKIKIENNKITAMGKDLAINESTGEYIGVAFIKKEHLKILLEILEDLIQKNKKSYYDLAFIELSKKINLEYVFLNGEKWTEIDFKEDLEKLKEILKEEKN